MKSIIEFFGKLDKSVVILINIPLIIICGLIDFQTGIEFDFTLFYVIPISITAWYSGKNFGILLSIVSEIIWFSADMFGGHIYTTTTMLVWNSLMQLIIFMTIAILLPSFKLKIHKHYKIKLLLQRNENIIETFQKLTAVISENIIQQNAEIIMWVNKKKNKGEDVSQKVDKASQIIGLSMKLLSETSFAFPYNDDIPTDPDMYLDLMKRKLSQINHDVSGKKDQ